MEVVNQVKLFVANAFDGQQRRGENLDAIHEQAELEQTAENGLFAGDGIAEHLSAPVAVAQQLVEAPRMQFDATAEAGGVFRGEERLRLVIIHQIIRRQGVQLREFLAIEGHGAAAAGFAEEGGEDRAGEQGDAVRQGGARRGAARQPGRRPGDFRQQARLAQ